MLFELNCGYHSGIFFKKNTNPCSQLKMTDKLVGKLQNLITICQENLHHVLKLQKQAYNKSGKPKNYALGDKVWLNSKYLKIKYNKKLKAMFFYLFQVLYQIGKQAYKLELPKNRKFIMFFTCYYWSKTLKKKSRSKKGQN